MHSHVCCDTFFTFRHVKGLFFGLLREEAFLEACGYRCMQTIHA